MDVSEGFTLQEVHPSPSFPPFLNGSCIKTYFITVKGSKRKPWEKLRLPTSSCFILCSDGFNSKTSVNSPAEDLLRANQEICRLEKENPYPVFVLEDDVEWTARMSEGKLRMCLRLFEKERELNLVTLGCVPLLSTPSSHRGFHRIHSATVTHALLISQRGREKLLSMKIFFGLPHDIFMYRMMRCLCPRYPLAVQPHPRTENSRVWDKSGLLLSFLNKDKDVEENYKKHHNSLRHNGLFGTVIAVASYTLSVGVVAASV